MKRMMVSPLTNIIWYGIVKENGAGWHIMPGKREDVTDDAIRAVFEWMLLNLEKEGGAAYQIRYPSIKAVLEIRKEDTDES